MTTKTFIADAQESFKTNNSDKTRYIIVGKFTNQRMTHNHMTHKRLYKRSLPCIRIESSMKNNNLRTPRILICDYHRFKPTTSNNIHLHLQLILARRNILSVGTREQELDRA